MLINIKLRKANTKEKLEKEEQNMPNETGTKLSIEEKRKEKKRREEKTTTTTSTPPSFLHSSP